MNASSFWDNVCIACSRDWMHISVANSCKIFSARTNNKVGPLLANQKTNPAENNFMRPLLCFAAEISAGWQHRCILLPLQSLKLCTSSALCKYAFSVLYTQLYQICTTILEDGKIGHRDRGMEPSFTSLLSQYVRD
jgi:hypothetical protein